MSKKRAYTPQEVETMVLTSSARRCALCFGLNHDFSEKSGQIAHVDKNRSDSSYDNLVWLCLEHHDRYDSRTSQSKGITKFELRDYRDKLYAVVENITENLSRTAQIAPDLERAQTDQDTKRNERAEELYLLVQGWSATVSAIYRNLHLLVEDRITFNDHLDAVISLGKNNPGEFAKLSMIVNMYFPELKLDLAKAQIATSKSSQITDKLREEWESDYYDGYRYKDELREAEAKMHHYCRLLLDRVADIVRSA